MTLVFRDEAERVTWKHNFGILLEKNLWRTGGKPSPVDVATKEADGIILAYRERCGPVAEEKRAIPVAASHVAVEMSAWERGARKAFDDAYAAADECGRAHAETLDKFIRRLAAERDELRTRAEEAHEKYLAAKRGGENRPEIRVVEDTREGHRSHWNIECLGWFWGCSIDCPNRREYLWRRTRWSYDKASAEDIAARLRAEGNYPGAGKGGAA